MYEQRASNRFISIQLCSQPVAPAPARWINPPSWRRGGTSITRGLAIICLYLPMVGAHELERHEPISLFLLATHGSRTPCGPSPIGRLTGAFYDAVKLMDSPVDCLETLSNRSMSESPLTSTPSFDKSDAWAIRCVRPSRMSCMGRLSGFLRFNYSPKSLAQRSSESRTTKLATFTDP